MSVPTVQLEELQLSGGMPPHTRSMSGSPASAEVHQRAIHVRDILSTFEENCLPSEFRPDIFQTLIRTPRISDDPIHYRAPRQLDVTLFRVGAYFTQHYEALRTIESDDILARHFCETLDERFTTLFERYDRLREQPSAAGDPSPVLLEIIEGLRKHSELAAEDRSQRRVRESRENASDNNDQRFASLLIKQIRALCERSRVRPAKRNQRSPRTPPNRKSYLFQDILGNASAETGFFGLAVLKSCSGKSLERLQAPPDGRGLRYLRDVLESEGASQAYQAGFATLVTEEEEAEEDE